MGLRYNWGRIYWHDGGDAVELWEKIRNEYVSTRITTRQLAEKYGVPYITLARKCRDEKWVQLRQQADSRAIAIAVKKAGDINGEIDVKLKTAAIALIEKATEGIRAVPAEDARSMQAYGRVLQSARDVLNIKSPADAAEQDARIAKLRRETETLNGDAGKSITIELGDADRWAT